MPTYFVHNYEVAAVNWQLGSLAPLGATKGELLTAVWKSAPNSSKWDRMLGLETAGLSLMSFSMFNPGIALKVNTSEVYHSGLKLDDPLTKQRSHDYLLFTSPRKVACAPQPCPEPPQPARATAAPERGHPLPQRRRHHRLTRLVRNRVVPIGAASQVRRRTESLVLLARVPTKFDVWPQAVEDYEFSLQTAANIVAPPTFTGELVKLDKGRGIEVLKNKHNLRPFLLDVYNVEFNFDG